MLDFTQILKNENITEENDTSMLDEIAKKVKLMLESSLKKINKKDFKGNFTALKKFNTLQVTLNNITDNF